MDIQNKLFEQIKAKLSPDIPLGKALMEDLDLSRDSAYRRARGETALTPEEIRLLCTKYEISFDKIIGVSGQSVTFQFNPIQRSEFTFNRYLQGINDGFSRMAAQRWQKLYVSNLDLIVFQLLNIPSLMRFKLFYFAKVYLQIPQLDKEKYHKNWKGDISDALMQDTLQKYIRIPSVEVIGFEAGKGLVREIVTFYEMGHIESKEDAIFLLEEVERLMEHNRNQAEIGKKFILGQPVVVDEDNFKFYLHDTYLQDNTFIAETNAYRMLYVTHNMMNYLFTLDPDYVHKSYHVFQSMLKNCKQISETNPGHRNAYFSSIQSFIVKAKLRLEGLDLI
jgi:hypothetical protein